MATINPVGPDNIHLETNISANSAVTSRQLKEGKEMLLEKKMTNLNLEKFTIRPARMSDLPNAVKLFERCAKAVIGTSDVNPDEVKNEWQAPKFSLQESVRVVHNRDGQMVGYVEVWDIDVIPVNIWVWLRVHPDYKGQGIGSMLLDWAEKRASKAIPRVPDDVQVVMEAGTYHIFQHGHVRLINHEMKPIRHFLTMSVELDESIPDPSWPEEITVRTMAEGEDPELIIRAVYDAFQDHWGFVQQPFEDSYERWSHFIRESEDFDPNLWFLAMDGDEIAGMSLCWPKANEDIEMGWVGTLGVRPPWRKRGLGLALLHHTFGQFAERGQKRVGLGVDGKCLTGATRLYERAGMNTINNRQFDLYQKVLRQGRDISRQEL